MEKCVDDFAMFALVDGLRATDDAKKRPTEVPVLTKKCVDVVRRGRQ